MEQDKLSAMNIRKNVHLAKLTLHNIRLFKPPTLSDGEISELMREAGRLWRCPQVFEKYEKIDLNEVPDMNTDGKNVFWDEDNSYRDDLDQESGQWIKRYPTPFIGAIEANRGMLADIVSKNGKDAILDLIKKRGVPKIKVAGIVASYIALLNSWAIYEIFPFVDNPNTPLLRLIEGGYLPRHYKHGWVLIYASQTSPLLPKEQ